MGCSQESTTQVPTRESPQPSSGQDNSEQSSAPIEVDVLPTDTLVSPELSSTATPIPVMPTEPIGGIELHSITDSGGLSLIQNTDTHWIRYNDLSWEDVEPVEGERNWEVLSDLENELLNASAGGYEVILIIYRSTEWARSVQSHACSPVKPEKLDSFADFMFELVTKYSSPPYNVKNWELGNEPDVDYKLIPPTMPFGCWGDDQDEYYGGGYYAEMLKTVYPRIKAADPEAQVLVGGLLLDCDPINPAEIPPGSGEHANCTPVAFLN